MDDDVSINTFSLNTILYGPPGTGKTYTTFRHSVKICDGIASRDEKAVRDRYRQLVKERRVEFVTFHQSYGYEEFVEGLRPETDGGAGFELKPRDGILKRIADRARKDLDRNYVLVIDEINRGNISKVFGEAITLVEEDKREGKPNKIPVTLPYSGMPFTLPPNLYILGTMNTADRSIALLDTALRRRFEFEELPPSSKELSIVDGIALPKVLDTMNERLEWFLSRDHLIGHAWLMEARSKDDVNRIMRHKIIPMLAEYFHDDWNRVRAVLGGGDSFVEREKLGAPPELDNTDTGEDRYRWTIRKEFPNDAYARLIAGKARQTEAQDDVAEDDNA
ncbi:MAG: AAA domain-containing protein [Rhodospirillaceae bacterium]|nr:AAA domain-containing protein [Rhodospirillaceae bacterium]